MPQDIGNTSLYPCRANSVSHTACAMAWCKLQAHSLELFDVVAHIQTERDGVDLCLWMLALDVGQDQLHRPDAAAC